MLPIRLFFILFFVTSHLCAVDTRKDMWEKTHWIWNFGIISSCDKGIISSPIKYFTTEPSFNPKLYQGIKSGDIVWIKCKFIHKFSSEILPKVKKPFVLVISDGDESFPTDCNSKFDIEQFINNENIIHIFTQNYDYHGSSSKITPLPIGLDYHTIGYKSPQGGWGEKGSPKNQEAELNRALSKFLPTYKRKQRAFVDFQLSDTMHGGFNRYLQFGEDRTSIFNYLLSTGLIDYSGFMRRSKLWKKKGEYAFSISPHGNGLDCHRTWEDLVLGCIVIVKSSPLDPLYEGLPVVIVSEWSEITPENFDLWITQYADAFTNPNYREKLSNTYWFNKIKSKALPYKNL